MGSPAQACTYPNNTFRVIEHSSREDWTELKSQINCEFFMSFASNSPEREEGIARAFYFLLRKWFLKLLTSTPDIRELRPYKDFKIPKTNLTRSRKGQENKEAFTPRRETQQSTYKCIQY